MLTCNFSSHAAKLNERRCRMDCRVKPGNDERKSSRDACASEFCQSQVHESHSHEKPRASGAPGGAGSWATPRGRMLPPAHASGVARATDDPLARTACFGRAAPPGAPPPSRFSAAAVDRHCLRAAFRCCQPESPAGVLTERIDSLCNGKREGVSRRIFLSLCSPGDCWPQGDYGLSFCS
jgi:hypothetical protein